MGDQYEPGFGPTGAWDSSGMGGVRAGGSSGMDANSDDSGLFYTGAAPEEETPDLIGPFRILEELGEGGFGLVYLAEQREPVQRRVALKVVKPGMDSREVLARFNIERQALAMMSHPAIASIFDAGVSEKGRPYFAMEYVRGTPLTVYCDANQLTVRRRLELFAQICDGVHHAHQKGIIHRDLKPANILVSDEDGEPRPRIIDFGVAKALSQPLTDEAVHTRRQQLIGTLEYMSPEQASEAADDVDVRADVYALGAVLYELLTGVMPFDKGTWGTASLPQIQEMIRTVDPPSPSRRLTTLGDRAGRVAKRRATHIDSLSRELRRDLQLIPQMAMRKDRTRRYQSAAALAEDIRAYLDGRPLKAHPESRRYLVGKFFRRHRTGVVVGAMVALVLVAATAVSVAFAMQAGRESESASRKASGMSEIVDALTDSVVAGEGSLRDRMLAIADKTLPELDDHPDAEAEVRLKIGRTLYQLGDLENSEQMLERAQTLYQRLYGTNSLQTEEAELRLGYLRFRQGRFAEAMAHFETCERILDQIPGAHADRDGNVLFGRAMTLRKQGQLDEATKLLDEAEQLFRRGDLRTQLGEVFIEQADVARALGRPKQAEAVLKQALDLWVEDFGDADARIGVVLSRLAEVQTEDGRFADALESVQRSLAIQKDLDPLSPRLARTYLTNAQALLKRTTSEKGAPEDLEIAADLTGEALRIYRLRYGANHEYVAGTMLTQGQIELASQRAEAAESTFRKALAIYESNPETPGWIVGVARMRLVESLTDLERWADAERQLNQSWRAISETQMTARRKAVIETAVRLYEAWGRDEKATQWRSMLGSGE